MPRISQEVAAEVVVDLTETERGIIPSDEVQKVVWQGWADVTPTWTQWTNSTTVTYRIQQDRVWNRWTVDDAWTVMNPAINGTITYNTAFTTTQDYVWTNWNAQSDTVYTRTYHQMDTGRTAEEIQHLADRRQALNEAESRRRLRYEQEREQAAARAQAHDRGMELLKMVMSHEELALFEIAGKIHVRGSEGGLYEIDTQYGGVHGNVVQVDEHGCQLGRICVAPQMRLDSGVLPLSDGYVGQYLAIKHQEALFRATGNWSQRRTCQQPNVPILGEQRAA
jgi:hypothetical protein